MCCSGLAQHSRLHGEFAAGDASLSPALPHGRCWAMLGQGLLRSTDEAIAEILEVSLETLDLSVIDKMHHLDNSDWWWPSWQSQVLHPKAQASTTDNMERECAMDIINLALARLEECLCAFVTGSTSTMVTCCNTRLGCAIYPDVHEH